MTAVHEFTDIRCAPALLKTGLTFREIAVRVGVSEATVRRHCERVGAVSSRGKAATDCLDTIGLENFHFARSKGFTNAEALRIAADDMDLRKRRAIRRGGGV